MSLQEVIWSRFVLRSHVKPTMTCTESLLGNSREGAALGSDSLQLEAVSVFLL